MNHEWPVYAEWHSAQQSPRSTKLLLGPSRPTVNTPTPHRRSEGDIVFSIVRLCVCLSGCLSTR